MTTDVRVVTLWSKSAKARAVVTRQEEDKALVTNRTCNILEVQATCSNNSSSKKLSGRGVAQSSSQVCQPPVDSLSLSMEAQRLITLLERMNQKKLRLFRMLGARAAICLIQIKKIHLVLDSSETF